MRGSKQEIPVTFDGFGVTQREVEWGDMNVALEQGRHVGVGRVRLEADGVATVEVLEVTLVALHTDALGGRPL